MLVHDILEHPQLLLTAAYCHDLLVLFIPDILVRIFLLIRILFITIIIRVLLNILVVVLEGPIEQGGVITLLLFFIDGIVVLILLL